MIPLLAYTAYALTSGAYWGHRTKQWLERTSVRDPSIDLVPQTPEELEKGVAATVELAQSVPPGVTSAAFNVGTWAAGRAFPVLGGVLFAYDVYRFIDYTYPRYPDVYRGFYEGLQDRLAYSMPERMGGHRDFELYYEGEWYYKYDRHQRWRGRKVPKVGFNLGR
jgi:hypothetical protein